MGKVVIPKWLAERIDRLNGLHLDSVMIMHMLLGEMDSSKEKYINKNLKLVNLARAIEEGYEVEKECLTIEQMFELPKGTVVAHEIYPKEEDYMVIDGVGFIEWKRTGNQVWLEKALLSPKWYVVE